MKFICNNLFTTIIYILSINISYCQDILLHYDMLPIDNNNSIYEISTKSYNSKEPLSSFISNNSINSLNPKKFIKYNFGILGRNRGERSFDLSYTTSKYNRNGEPRNQEINYIKLNLKYLNLLNSGKDSWKLNTGFTYNSLNEYQISCYEGYDYFISINSNTCSHKSKPIFYTSLNQNAIKVDGDLFGVELGLRKSRNYWGIKNTISFGIKTNLIKYKVLFNDVFSKNSLSHEETFPQSSPWISHDFYYSYRQAKKLNKNWALGSALTFKKSLRQNFVISEGDTSVSDNIILDLNISRKFGDSFYFGLGGSFNKNYLIGEDPIKYIRGNTNIFKNNVSTFTLKIGYIKNNLNKKKYYDNSSFEELLSENLEKKNLNAIKNDNKITVFQNEIILNKLKDSRKSNYKKDVYTKKDLLTYALNFAEKYDSSLKFLSN